MASKSLEEIKADLAKKRQPSPERQHPAVTTTSDNGEGRALLPRHTAPERPTSQKSPPTAKRSPATFHAEQNRGTFVHRTPPHSVEAEHGVLGSMLISPREAIPEVVEKITPDHFFIPAHQTTYEVLVDLWNASQAIDLITFTQVLRDRNLLDTVGGASFVTSLWTFVPTAANLGYYLEIIRDKYILRQIISAATESVQRAFDEQDEVGTLVDEIEQRFIGIGDDRFQSSVKSMADNCMSAIEMIQAAYERKGGLVGIGTGFTEFDRMTGGLRPAEMVVIAARPSMGKTALAMNIVEQVAVNDKKPVGVFSLEMSTEQLTQRMLCSRSRVNMQKVRDGFLSERDFPCLTAASSKLSEAKIYIDDSSGISILQLRAKARRLHAQFGIELLVVDYLQLLRSDSKRRDDNRQVEVSEISSGLKTLCKELKIPIIVCAQLNRQPEARHGGKPRLSDLRESGSIEQDADVVALLVRPEVYEDDADLRNEMAGEAELIIAKQRNGPIGEIPLTFLKEFTRFEDRARDNAEPTDDL